MDSILPSVVCLSSPYGQNLLLLTERVIDKYESETTIGTDTAVVFSTKSKLATAGERHLDTTVHL